LLLHDFGGGGGSGGAGASCNTRDVGDNIDGECVMAITGFHH
jgi:hypothetical protein